MDISNIRCPQCKKPMTPVVCKCFSCDLKLEGTFEVSPLAQLPSEDQALVIAFIRSYGSIKKLQDILGVSYPTARARLDRVLDKLNLTMSVPVSRDLVIEKLEKGEIDVDEALEQL